MNLLNSIKDEPKSNQTSNQMGKKSMALYIAKNYEEQLRKTGKFVCNHCNRTGINPNYCDINKIVRALDGDDAFFCLHCYGKKEIDWIEYASGYFEQDLKNRKHDMG